MSNAKQFVHACVACGLPEPVLEHRLAYGRKFRFDLSWPRWKVALEIEGGVWTRGRHTRPAGFLKDMEKYNLAAMLGWSVLRVVPDSLMEGCTFVMVRGCLEQRGCEFIEWNGRKLWSSAPKGKER